MFISDCIVSPRDQKRVPLTALDKLLALYCEHIGAVKPSTKTLANVLRETFSEVRVNGGAQFICAIRPNILKKEG